MKSLKIIMMFLAVFFSAMSCSAQKNSDTVREQLSKAKENGNTVFMVVTDSKTSAEKLTQLITEATKELSKTQIIQMNTDDEKNVELVKEYKLSGAPMPLMILFSDRGLILGGMIESQVTKENIIEAIPTPKYSEITYALSQGKPVFTIVSNNRFKSDKSARELCESAKKEMLDKAEVIIVDAEDAKESKLITMLNIKNKLEDTFIIAINGQGIMAGRFDAIPTKADLITAANKVMQSGCAPGGCGPTCK